MINTDEQVRQLDQNTHKAGGLYYADGTAVRRLYPAEGQDPGVHYQEYCPCCDLVSEGVTAGMITPPDELNPLQRVQWNEGGASDWPPHLLRRI